MGVSRSDIEIILNRYKCINKYKIDVSYFNINIDIYISEGVFVMDLLNGFDIRKELDDLKDRVPMSINVKTNIILE
jgi:hypothetical protein